MRTRLALTVIAGLLLLAGCSNGSNTPSAPPSNEMPPTAMPNEAPPTANTPRDGTASLDSRLTVTGVRISHHNGFDRVVYDMGGTGWPPGWHAQYTDRAVQNGSGKLLDISGTSILELEILGTSYPWDSGVPGYSGPDPASDPSAPSIAGVYGTQAYEGTTQSFIGVNGDRPAFSVSVLDRPVRLVVDVATG